MFESKSPVIRAGAYIIIGFFTLIIIISFGMPDFMTKLGMDDNVVAVVNGEKIYRLDFVRFKDRMSGQIPNIDKKEMQDQILSQIIMRRLLLQKADEIGIQISDTIAMDYIKNIFKDKTGKFNKNYLDRTLQHYHQGLADFVLMVKEDLIIDQLRQMIFMGVGVSPEEVRTEYAINNSRIQIRYCYVSGADLSKRFKDKINISEKDIDEELHKSKDEIKDPVTDRKRIKDKLEKEMSNKFKTGLVNLIDKLAEEKKSFNEAASNLGGKVFISNIFKIGDPVRDGNDKGKMLYSLSNSAIFNEGLFSLGKGITSRVIDSFDGLYIFTPVRNDIFFNEPPVKEFTRIENEIFEQKNNSVFMSVISSFHEKSKIIRNLKFN
ncbi:MAG: SurA N-terminal domain-containing protein [Spirochaetes bacterium]|nr:SurA N-terminal domain-containing protein [Spirochaetota bacterium]